MTNGRGLVEGYLATDELTRIVRDGLAHLPLDGKRVLIVIPDGTRTMPVPLMVETFADVLGSRTAALDYLVALGTHTPMRDAQLGRLVGQTVIDGRFGRSRIFNHRWDEPAALVELGTIPSRDIAELTAGRFTEPVPVALNRLVTQYDHVIICGPVFPHEVAGFSGGTKYLFPGIAAPAIIHFTHWLGALVTNYAIIGTAETPVRAVIDRAAALLDTPLSLVALVVTHDGTAGVFCGDVHDAWRQAAALSARRHIVWVEEAFDRVLSVMPPMYEDLWTAGKGMYKVEPAVADGGEVIIYAPHVREVSHVHGALIESIGYHCRDYFLAQWDRFADYPGGILAHSTHVKGLGAFDQDRGETARVQVTLATGIAPDLCARINLGYTSPDSVDPAEWPDDLGHDTLMVPRAGELLFRVGAPPG
ncbi:MAG TPA: lactate racemase domain-containing protein [Vicinamibacterales bacterium]|jgi:nickel-dependent lactate racemase|nr:lactate racemase domain-containing protein [Vicinamibacterales bacterium]